MSAYAHTLREHIVAAYKSLEGDVGEHEDIVFTVSSPTTEFSIYLGRVSSFEAGFLQFIGRTIEDYSLVIILVPAQGTSVKLSIVPLRHTTRMGFMDDEILKGLS